MSTEHPEGGQPVGQLSPDGHWRWDGHNWVPAQQVPAGAGPNPWPQGGQQQHAAQPQYAQQPHGAQPYAQQQYGQQQYSQPYGGMPPGAVQPKKGLPTWAKVLITLLVLFVGLIVLLTVVGLAASESYADWSCEDVADEALTIDPNKEEALALTDVTALEVEEDNRKDFSPAGGDREVVLSCTGTGEWTDLGEAPVLVVLEANDDGERWVRYEMMD